VKCAFEQSNLQWMLKVLILCQSSNWWRCKAVDDAALRIKIENLIPSESRFELRWARWNCSGGMRDIFGGNMLHSFDPLGHLGV